jgi:uncharacterized short protein YbdD (DUF466 family)
MPGEGKLGNVGNVRDAAMAERRRDNRSLGSLIPAFRTFLRSLAGMPDYERHIQHLRQYHPELPVPTEREFYEDFIRTRYEAGPTRCC